MKKLLLTSGVFICCINPVITLADQTTINDIEDAGRSLNINVLQTLVQSENLYDAALAQYRLAISYSSTNNIDEAQVALTKAIAQLETLINKETNNAEALALLSLVYGTQVGFSPMKSADYGPKAGRIIAKAKAIAPHNPRVNLVAGINDYFTPTMFGGSKTSALEELDNAIANYAKDEDSGCHWGFAEAYVWRGLIQIELGERQKALDDWKTALNIEPDFYWASALLKKNQ